MNNPLPETSFSRLRPWTARLILAAVLLSLVTAVGVSLSRFAKGYADKPSRGPGDVALYRAEVDRIQAGESYYAAASTELRARGYPTKSVFNWRTPLPIWLIGVMPDPVFGKALLCGLALLTVVLAFDWLGREGGTWVAVAGVLSLCGAMLPCFLGNLFVMPVLWSGFLFVLSLALLAANRTGWGVAAGSLALFLRDLAGPFVVVMLLLALCRRRYREAAYWTVGLFGYGLFFLWHIVQVHAMQTPGARAQEDSWVQLGGLAFVISTTQLNGWLLVLPQWVAALYLPLALLGFASWKGAAGERAAIAAAAYVLLFGFVGQDFNQYWGSLIAPLLCLGFAWTAPALHDLVRASRNQSLGSVAAPVVDAVATGA
ncbi:MAG: hypothetical protein K8T91_21625 [Planctomycetes bacterium]|nr:hypothetical protein [Planctomycetota bacterium]